MKMFIIFLTLASLVVYANGLLCYTCSWAPSKFLTGISTLQDPVADIYLGLNNINCRDNFNPVGISKINCTEFFGPAVCVKAISQAGDHTLISRSCVGKTYLSIVKEICENPRYGPKLEWECHFCTDDLCNKGKRLEPGILTVAITVSFVSFFIWKFLT